MGVYLDPIQHIVAVNFPGIKFITFYVEFAPVDGIRTLITDPFTPPGEAVTPGYLYDNGYYSAGTYDFAFGTVLPLQEPPYYLITATYDSNGVYIGDGDPDLFSVAPAALPQTVDIPETDFCGSFDTIWEPLTGDDVGIGALAGLFKSGTAVLNSLSVVGVYVDLNSNAPNPPYPDFRALKYLDVGGSFVTAAVLDLTPGTTTYDGQAYAVIGLKLDNLTGPARYRLTALCEKVE